MTSTLSLDLSRSRPRQPLPSSEPLAETYVSPLHLPPVTGSLRPLIRQCLPRDRAGRCPFLDRSPAAWLLCRITLEPMAILPQGFPQSSVSLRRDNVSPSFLLLLVCPASHQPSVDGGPNATLQWRRSDGPPSSPLNSQGGHTLRTYFHTHFTHAHSIAVQTIARPPPPLYRAMWPSGHAGPALPGACVGPRIPRNGKPRGLFSRLLDLKDIILVRCPYPIGRLPRPRCCHSPWRHRSRRFDKDLPELFERARYRLGDQT
jgi:hypothetical protein